MGPGVRSRAFTLGEKPAALNANCSAEIRTMTSATYSPARQPTRTPSGLRKAVSNNAGLRPGICSGPGAASVVTSSADSGMVLPLGDVPSRVLLADSGSPGIVMLEVG